MRWPEKWLLAGAAAATRYDPAGNRTSYGVSGTAPSGQAAASQSASAGDVATDPDEVDVADKARPAAVEPPPPGGIPDESEPAVESEPPDGGAHARGGDR